MTLVLGGRLLTKMRRGIRFAWVLVVNSAVAWVTFARLRSVGFAALDLQLVFEFVFEMLIPIIGIILEAANLRLARLTNIGCFLVAAVFWIVAAAVDHSDRFFSVLLIFGVGLLLIAGLTEVIYQRTTGTSLRLAVIQLFH